jgi:hypothetical protein
MKMHMSVTREFLLRLLDEQPDAWKEITEGASSREEARAFIKNGPPFHPIGSECKGFDYEHGRCPGHRTLTPRRP